MSQYNYYPKDLSLPKQVILGKVRVGPGEGAHPCYSLNCNKVDSISTFPTESNWYIGTSNRSHYLIKTSEMQYLQINSNLTVNIGLEQVTVTSDLFRLTVS